MKYTWLDDTPVGQILIAGTDAGLHYVSFQESYYSSECVAPTEEWELNDRAFKDAKQQLSLYFIGKCKQFDLPLAPTGTPFQQSVWKALCKVEYGRTATYGDIARTIGNPNACRAVGLANGQNPIAIVIPCHRIIGRSGKLTGYGGGLQRKQTLLDLESGVRSLLPHC